MRQEMTRKARWRPVVKISGYWLPVMDDQRAYRNASFARFPSDEFNAVRGNLGLVWNLLISLQPFKSESCRHMGYMYKDASSGCLLTSLLICLLHW